MVIRTIIPTTMSTSVITDMFTNTDRMNRECLSRFMITGIYTIMTTDTVMGKVMDIRILMSTGIWQRSMK